MSQSPFPFPAAAFNLDSVEHIDFVLGIGVRRQLRVLDEIAAWQEIEDVQQEAWIGFLAARQRGELVRLAEDVRGGCATDEEFVGRFRRAAWMFVQRCGEFAAWNYVKRRFIHDVRAVELTPEAEECVQVMPHSFRSLRKEFAALLEEEFYLQRAKRGARGRAAAKRDVAVLKLAIEGFSDDGIALEIGSTPEACKSWRAQVKARLRRIQATGGIDLPDQPLRAAGQTCVRCGAPAHSLHHIVPRRAAGPDEPANLVPLCLDCHSEVEAEYMRQERPGLKPADWQGIFERWQQGPTP